MSDDYDALPLNTDNPDPRVACTILVDVSSSMSGEPIRELNKGYQDFITYLQDDELASRRAEVAVIEFESTARVAVPMQEGRSLLPHTFTTGGATSMGAAINMALDVLDARKKEYKAGGIEYYRPWVIVFSDGAPTDGAEFDRAVTRLTAVQQRKGVTVFPIGIGSAANLATLGRLSTQRAAIKLDGVKFSAFFQWLSASMSAVSGSQTAGASDADLEEMTEQVQLPSIAGWATL